jgi:hypothetical protein
MPQHNSILFKRQYFCVTAGTDPRQRISLLHEYLSSFQINGPETSKSMIPRIWQRILSAMARILLLVFLATACSKKNQTSHGSQENTSKNLEAIQHQQKLRQPTIGPETSQISKSLKELSPDSDVIKVIFAELKKFDHPELDKQATIDELATALKGISPLSLRDELSDPNSRWNEDPALKSAVIGRLALLTGIIGAAGESYPRIPELFLEYSAQHQPTAEDALTLRIVDLASTIAEQKIVVSTEEFKAWEEIASAPNVCYRRIALLLFGSLQPTNKQAEQFFSKFFSESDPHIAELYIRKVVAASALVDSKSILTKFKDAPGAKTVMVFLETEIEGLKSK